MFVWRGSIHGGCRERDGELRKLFVPRIQVIVWLGIVILVKERFLHNTPETFELAT
jgi:hypothetical protein